MVTFESWMKRVDSALESRVSLTSGELPDWDWYDCYDEGYSPSAAAKNYLHDMDPDRFPDTVDIDEYTIEACYYDRPGSEFDCTQKKQECDPLRCVSYISCTEGTNVYGEWPQDV